MSANAKSSSEKALQAYFHDVSGTSVPTPEAEMATFRELLRLESQLVCRVLEVPGFEEKLRLLARQEEAKLPAKLVVKDGLHPEVLAFVRMTDPGRTWLQEGVAKALEGRQAAQVRKLSSKREDVKNRFVAANLRLTVMVAKKYSARCKYQSIGDLIQEGNIGLMRAVDRFDPDRGFKFATYAVWWIRHHVKRAVSDKETPIRIPVHVAELASKLSRLDGGYMAENGTSMDTEQLARAAKVPVEKVISVLSTRHRMLHLDQPVGEEGEMTLLDTVASRAFPDPLLSICSEESRGELLALLSGLTPFESRVIRHRFGIDTPQQLTLQEIADMYELSRERIRQIEEKALLKLRSRMGGRTFREYVLEAV
jgi:RNA polymerase sigma factor (sigma-70 family)